MSQWENKRNLVICRSGDNSLHNEWINPAVHKNFDLFIDYYGDTPNKYAEDADIYRQKKGFKWPELYNLVESYQSKILQYDAVWLPDDDLSIDCTRISKMFELFHCFDLQLAQPALSRDSFFSHPITLKNDQFAVRFTNFVEVMAPIFSQEALKLCWPTFKDSIIGWGLDFVWPKLLDSTKIAIIDEIPIRHTRPIGGGVMYKSEKLDPHKEEIEVAQKYVVKTPYCFCVSGGKKKTAEGQYEYIQHHEVWYDIGPQMVLFKEGRYQEFVSTVLEADLLQFCRKLYFYVGSALEKMAEYEQAINYFANAEQYLNEFDDILKSSLYYHTAFCLEKINGDENLIRQNYNLCLQLNPDHNMAKINLLQLSRV